MLLCILHTVWEFIVDRREIQGDRHKQHNSTKLTVLLGILRWRFEGSVVSHIKSVAKTSEMFLNTHMSYSPLMPSYGTMSRRHHINMWDNVTSFKNTTEGQIICLYLFSSEHSFNHCSSSFHTFRKDHDLWDCFINNFIKVVCKKIKEVTWTKASIILQYTGSIIWIIIIIIAMILLYAFEPFSFLES